MAALTWWFRIVGLLYLFVAVVSIGPRIPIRAEGPPGTLERAAAGDATARFVLDTWTMFGLYMGTIGLALLAASRNAADSRSLAWTVIALELIGGIGIDLLKLVRGYPKTPPIAWIVIHSLVIMTGWHFLQLP